MRSSLIFGSMVIGFFASASAHLRGADGIILRGDAPAYLQAAASPPPVDAALAAAQKRLATSVQELKDFLAGDGPERQGRWADWLQLPALQRELAAPRPDPAALRQCLDQFAQNQPGLELPPFVAVRHDLGRFLTVTSYARCDDREALYRRHLAELAECLSRLDSSPTQDDAHRAGQLTALFEEISEQGPALAATVRAHYGRTNGVAQFSGRLVNRLLTQEFAERQSIADFILGTYTYGTAWSRGQVSFHVIPNAERGLVEVLMQGRVVCPDNVAERRRVSVYSTTNTSIQATKRLFIDDHGLQFDPAAALCSTNLQINDVSANRRLVERLAWRRATRMTPEAEQAASQRAQAEASTQLDRRAAESLAGANDTFCQKVRAPLIRLDALPASWRFWTDDTHLRLSLVQHNRRQLAAATPAPDFSRQYDVALAAHTSMINNLAESGLGGATIRDETWAEMLKLLSGDYPRPLWVHDRSERWSVTFAKEQPLLVRFDSNRIGFTLRLAALTRGAREIKQPIEIDAQFVPQITREMPRVVRDGEVQVRIVGDVPPSETTALRDFLLRKFSAIFPSQIAFEGITPPVGGVLGRLRELKATEFQTGDGWLTLAYTLADAQP